MDKNILIVFIVFTVMLISMLFIGIYVGEMKAVKKCSEITNFEIVPLNYTGFNSSIDISSLNLSKLDNS